MGTGVYSEANYTNVLYNTLYSNGWGIRMFSFAGIYGSNISHNLIYNTTLSNGKAITLDQKAANFTLDSNTILGSAGSGIYLDDSSGSLGYRRVTNK